MRSLVSRLLVGAVAGESGLAATSPSEAASRWTVGRGEAAETVGRKMLAEVVRQLALHIANTVLVYMLALLLGRSRLAAVFGAALFAIRGTRPEVAVWIAGRFDLLSTFGVGHTQM